MNKREVGIIAGTFLVAILIIGFAIAHFRYGMGQNDKTYVAREFERLPEPPYMQFKSKSWDDAHSFDPTLNSVWDYGYTIDQGVSKAIVNETFKEFLNNHGYKITGTYKNPNYKDTIYEFQANNGKISIGGMIGTGRDANNQLVSGNEVGISAERL